MWNLLISGAVNLATSHFKNKAEEKKAVHERKLNQIANDASWEDKMADATANSWKDELLLVTLLLPVWATFYGALMADDEIISRVEHGLHALDVLPQWFSYLLFIAATASFGIKGADKLMSLRKK